jgi:hypothetical protein
MTTNRNQDLRTALEPTERQLHAAMDAFYPGEDWRADLGCALETSLRDMRAALIAAGTTAQAPDKAAERGGGLGETSDQIFDRLRIEHMVREWCEPLSKGPPGTNFVDGLIGVLRLRFKRIDPQYRPTSKAARAAYEAIAEARGITKDWAPATQSKEPRS